MHAGARLVVPAGSLKVRSNDTDYPFRAHADFSYLTGWASDAEPDSVLVLEPAGDGHDATLYFLGPAGRGTTEFYADPAIGEFWSGRAPRSSTSPPTWGSRPPTSASSTPRSTPTARRSSSPAPPRVVEALFGQADPDGDTLARDLSELRLVKDAWELAEVQAAVDATARASTSHRRPHRGHPARARRARRRGRVPPTRPGRRQPVGYERSPRSGHHASYLHWIRNDGAVREGDLFLLDAGVEVDSLYTADITRSCRSRASSPRCSDASTTRSSRRPTPPSRSCARASFQ